MDPKLKEAIDKWWPKTKVELEKVGRTTKTLIEKGETHVKSVSDKGLKEIKKLALNLRKEKLYFNLGKSMAGIPRSEWTEDKKIGSLLKELNAIDRNLRSVSKKTKPGA